MCTRVRIRGELAFLTLKSPKVGLGRDEFEYPIPLADAAFMLEHHCAGRIVRKTRYLVDHASHVFEIDVFEGHHTGLIVAEVELPHEQAALCLPEWIGPEITQDTRYSNFTLAMVESRLTRSGLHGLPAVPAPQLRTVNNNAY